MKKTILNVMMVAAVGILMVGCRKNDKLDAPIDTADGIIRNNQSEFQVFTVNGASGGTIVGKRGSKITFPPNAFANTAAVVFTGEVTVTLQESLSKNNWLADGLSTTTATQLLASGGMINVTAAAKNTGETLIEAPTMRIPAANPNDLSGRIQVDMPRARDTGGMQLFLPEVPGGAIGGGANAGVNAWRPAQFPFINSGTYRFQLPNFGWANCDRLYSVPGAKTTITVLADVAAQPGATDIKAHLIYASGLNLLINLPKQPDGSFKSYNNSIPMAMPATITILAKAADGKILFKKQDFTSFTTNQSITIAPVITTGQAVQDFLNSIN